MTGFLKSLFTEHLATKFMSLLLAIVLFAIVQQQLVGTRTITRIELRFQLDPKLESEYSVITESLLLRDTKIKGRILDVSDIKKRLEATSLRQIGVDQRFLSRYEQKSSIAIDGAFLREHVIGDEDILVTPEDGDLRLRIERNDEAVVEIKAAPGMEARTRLAEDSIYEGTADDKSVEVRFTIPTIRVRAPISTFPPERPVVLLAEFGDVNRYLASAPVGQEPRMPITRIDWEQSGIDKDHFQTHARFSIGGRWVTYAAFRSQLSATFEVRERKGDAQKDLVLWYVVGKEGRDVLKGYDEELPEGPVAWKQGDYGRGVAQNFALRYSKGRVVPERDFEFLVLILDIAAREPKPPDEILVPIRLGVKPGADAATRERLLQHVEIKMASGKEGKVPKIRFAKRP